MTRTPRTLCSAAAPRRRPATAVRLQGWVHRRRELAALTFLVVRDRTGLAQVVVQGRQPRCRPRRPSSRWSARRPQRRRRPVASRSPSRRSGADRAGRHPAGRALAADPQRRPADAARPCRRSPGGTRPSGRSGSWPPPPCAGFRATLDGARVHRDPHPEVRGVGDRVAAPTCSRSTTSAGRRTSPRARSSTSSSWSGVFERVYEVGPVFRAEPHDTVRHLAEYVSLDVELGFIERPPRRARGAARGARGHGRGRARARRRRRSSCSAPRVPVVPDEIPVLHFRDALRARRRAGRRARPGPRARAGAGRLGAGRARQRLPRRRGLPDGQAAVLHPPAARTTRAGRNSFDLLFRGLELVTGGQRLHRPSDYDARDPRPRRGPGGLRGVPPGLPARHAAARRLRDRARALGRPARRGGQHPRGHALPARPEPAVP